MVLLTHEEWTRIHQLTLEIYTITDSTMLRRTILTRIQDLIPHERSFFDLGKRHNHKIMFFSPISNNISDNDLNRYFKIFETADYMIWVFTGENAVVYRDSEMISDVIRENSFIYNEWMKPLGVYYSSGTSIMEKGIFYGSITLFRSKNKGDFTDKEQYILEILNEHIRIRFSQLYPKGISNEKIHASASNLIETYNLTNREQDVAQLLCIGMNNKEISEKLFISENTIKKHISNIFGKMNISSRIQLMKIAYEDVPKAFINDKVE